MAELGNINPDTYIKCPDCGYMFIEVFVEHVDEDGVIKCYKCGQKVRLPKEMREEIEKIKKNKQK